MCSHCPIAPLKNTIRKLLSPITIYKFFKTKNLIFTFTKSYHYIVKLKKRKGLLVFGALLALIGVVLWNVPGIKSRRLGEQCNKKYNSAIEMAESDKQRILFENARDVCYTNIARKYQNTQLCDRIEDEQMISVCYAHVYYWDKSVEFCEKDDQKNICLHIVSIKNRDKNVCSKIDNESIKKLCEQE